MKIKLTKEQKSKIVKIWNSRKENPPSIEELIIEVFGIESDGRSEEGIAIREFLAEKSAEVIKPKEKKIIELSEEQKEYIRNNHDKMTATEMSRIIFNDKGLWTGHPETRAVIAFKESLDPAKTYANEKTLKEFNPPRNEDQVIRLVNKIVLNAFNPEKIDGSSKKCLNAAIAYLNNERFLTEIEIYTDANERKMFINNFVRHIYDKPDLTQQDLDTLITWANEVIEHKRIQDQMEILRKQQTASDDVSKDAKLSMSLVEMINNCTNNLSKSKALQAKLLQEINEKRADRIKKQATSVSSLLNLIAEWTEEEGRLKLLKLAEARKNVLGEEIDRLSEMDSMHAAIFGATKEELLYG